MARSVSSSSLFRAQAQMGREKRPFFHVTDNEFAERLARKQQVMGVQSPHSSDAGSGPPIKKIKK